MSLVQSSGSTCLRPAQTRPLNHTHTHSHAHTHAHIHAHTHTHTHTNILTLTHTLTLISITSKFTLKEPLQPLCSALFNCISMWYIVHHLINWNWNNGKTKGK